MNGPGHWFDRIEAFLVRAPPLAVALWLLVLGAVGFEGLVTYSQSNRFCFRCHTAEGDYPSLNADSAAHEPYKKRDARCLSCHTDKDLYAQARRATGAAAKGFVEVTNKDVTRLPEADPGYTDANCLACHNDVLKLDKAEKLRLPHQLAGIGLAFSHRRHFWIKDFPPSAAERLAVLAQAGPATEEEKGELEFLMRARLARCGQCHDRVASAVSGEVPDRSINYFSLNPMRCTGCHTDAQRGGHPGTIHLALPREETCRRCHTGTFHGRLAVFRAECEGRDRTDCKRCHPEYEPPPVPQSDSADAVSRTPDG